MWVLASKIVTAPLLLWAVQAFRLIHYASWGQLVGVGFVIAIISMAADGTILPRAGNTNSTILDLAGVTLVVWLSGMVLRSAFTPLLGSLITGAVFAIVEYATHPLILGGARTTPGREGR